MKNKNTEQIVIEKINGFLISLFEGYCSNNIIKTDEECHKYLIQLAMRDKQVLLDTLTQTELESFKTIESNWLSSVETLNDFEHFLIKIKK